MDANVFRKKSLERVSSPEDLNSYLRVTNPSTWFVLFSVIIVLVGAIIWGTFGRIESKVQGVAVVTNGQNVCYVSEKYISDITKEQKITINNVDYEITIIPAAPVLAETILTNYTMNLGGFTSGEYVYAISFKSDLAIGNYSAEIVIESLSALSFLWNAN